MKIFSGIISDRLKDFVQFSLGYFVFSFFSLLLTAIINKSLDEYSLGTYSYTKSFFDLVVTITSLGLYSSYLRFNTNGVNKILVSFVVKFMIVTSLVTYLFFVYTINSWIASFYVLIIIFNERIYYLRSAFKTASLNKLRIGSVLITFLLVLFLVHFTELSPFTILMSYGAGYLLSVFFFSRNKDLRLKSISFSKSTLFKYSIPSTVLTIVDWLYLFSSQYIIKENFGYEELAPYSIAQRALLSVKLFTGLYLMFYPQLYFKEMDVKNISFIRKSRLLIVLSLIAVVSICFILSKYIYILMGASVYIDSIIYFKLLLIAELLKVLASLYGLYLSYAIKTHVGLFVMTIGSIVNITIMCMLINTGGIIIACYASIISFLLVFLMMIFFSYRLECRFLRSQESSI